MKLCSVHSKYLSEESLSSFLSFHIVFNVFFYLTYGQLDHTPLMSAALGGHCETVKLLLKSETNSGAIDSVSSAVSGDIKIVFKISFSVT
jgi:hypothetical protein